MTGARFTKGHGTHNDFVLFADTAGTLDISMDDVRRMCDRRGGIGADGVIRIARTADVPNFSVLLDLDCEAKWFMDYRNADGTVAEMCGNGIRVFAAFAERLGLLDFSHGPVSVGTRAGVKKVRKEASGWFAAELGPWTLPGGAAADAEGFDSTVTVPGWQVPRPALSVDLGNPHRVVALATAEKLESLDLLAAPTVDPAPRWGTNVEFIVPIEEHVDDDGQRVGSLQMRVHERGVGETQSCGTGACAAAIAARQWGGADAPDAYVVNLPGGTVRVRIDADQVELAGPAELVFDGEIDIPVHVYQ